MNIIKNIVGENKREWDSKIKDALWTYRIMTKNSTRKTSFELVYELEAKLPIDLWIPTLHFSQPYMNESEALQGIIDQSIELDESRGTSLDQMACNQENIKGMFDHKARQWNFKEGNHVLVWDKRK